MKKVIICDIPMKLELTPCVYESTDESIPASEIPVVYPINSFLDCTLSTDDELKVLLLVKRDCNGNYVKNAERFINEFSSACEWKVNSVEIKTIETDYSEEQIVHERLLGEIIEFIEDGSYIIADITYGPKDLPIVLFSALTFAEKFLNCEIGNILYGQVDFVNGLQVNPRLCDMVPLYNISTVANTIRCESSDKARKMLKVLLSL